MKGFITRQDSEMIERIPHHLEQIRLCKGGNEYREGRKEKDSREWKKIRIKGKLSV